MGQVEDCVVCFWVLVGCVEVGKGWYQVDVVGVVGLDCQGFVFVGVVDQFDVVVQLLYCGVGDEDVVFYCVVDFVVQMVVDCGEQVVF